MVHERLSKINDCRPPPGLGGPRDPRHKQEVIPLTREGQTGVNCPAPNRGWGVRGTHATWKQGRL